MRIFLTFVICTFLPIYNFAQNKGINGKKLSPTEQAQLEKAQLMIEEKNYRLALPVLEKLLSEHPGEIALKYYTGLCYFSRPDKSQVLLQYLNDVYSVNKRAEQIEYHLARAYFLNYKLDEAMNFLNLYSLKLKKTTDLQKRGIEQLTKNIQNAKRLMENPLKVEIKNLGSTINSNASETSPYVTASDSLLIFTYRGELSTGGLQNAYNEADPQGIYYEDVFKSTNVNGIWTKPQGINGVNSNNNDEALFISYDGQKLFLSRDNQEDDGDIYISTYAQNDWTSPVKLAGNVNTSFWEDNCCLSLDGKTLFFSSSRPGGFGGKDIYKASLMPDDTWGLVQNLGDKINTSEDDDYPFFHMDGKLLLFSSKGRGSMGGYDIFKTYLNPGDSSWSVPENIGYPVNTPDDNVHYVLSPGGDKGFYALSKADGFGDNDLYSVEPGITGIMPAMLVVKGIVLQDDKPVTSDIIVKGDNNLYKSYSSNAVTGSYQFVLPLGQNYTIKYKLNDSLEQTQTVEAAASKEYLLKTNDINFKSKQDLGIGSNSTDNKIIAGLAFKIQISAEYLNKNIDRVKIKEFGKIERAVIDKIARFTLNIEYKTLNEAKDILKKIRDGIVPDAFITGVYQGKRYYVHELRKMGILYIDRTAEITLMDR